MAANLVKSSMLAVQDRPDVEAVRLRLVMQVHDELVLEVPQDGLAAVREHLPELMCSVATLCVPSMAEVGVGANWEEVY